MATMTTYAVFRYSLLNTLFTTGLSSLHPHQTLLFTGCHGSGKTTNFTHALDYLRYLDDGLVAEKIFNFNLFLSFFGDVVGGTKCVKLVQIEFDFKGRGVGGSVASCKGFLRSI